MVRGKKKKFFLFFYSIKNGLKKKFLQTTCMYSLLLVLLKPQEHFKKIDNLKKYFFFSEFYCESRSLTSRLNFASHAVGFLYYCNLQWINITLDH